jgi:glycosyltransferase involved in cell wall biosynthesis
MDHLSISACDLICFSHLRWDFVYQRPQHLFSRFAKKGRVFYIEEPVFDSDYHYHAITRDLQSGVYVVVPHLSQKLSAEETILAQKQLLDSLLLHMKIVQFMSWYYSPMFFPFSKHLKPELLVYDCMDELSAFWFASENLKENEYRLMLSADIVFTGGQSLYLAKKDRHANIHSIPSSIDKEHFMKARSHNSEPEDQRSITGFKLGYYGVIDERINLALVNELAEKRPEWQFIYIGPVVKIDPATLPRHNNIHYLGPKQYTDLPAYLSGWDVALMPFAINESTRYISPTKTPEYLAGGKPVISTPVADVISGYCPEGLVHIAFTPDEFIEAAETERRNKGNDAWLGKVDHHLSFVSWNRTWSQMVELMDRTIRNKNAHNTTKIEAYV